MRTYWEMLSDVNDGYSLAEKLWREVEPLYNKLRAFVKKRLFTYYGCSEENFNETDVFPVYMTGKWNSSQIRCFTCLAHESGM